MRGQTWQVEEMLKLFLVIMVFGGATLLIIAASGGLTSVLNDFCEKNPDWCGSSETENEDYANAKASVEALVCAINTVATGSIYAGSGCSNFYGSVPEEIDNDDIFGGGRPGSTGAGGGFIVAKDVRDFMTGFAVDQKEINEPLIECTESSCVVRNFHLPQEISDAEEWIEGFGDPRFLVYYYKFPHGEEAAWSGWSEWFKGSDTLIFGAMCFSQIALFSGHLFARPAKSLIKIGEVPIEAFRGIKKLSKLTGRTVKEAGSVGMDIATSRSKKEVVEKLYIYSGVVALEQTENAFRLFKNIAPSTAGYVGIASGLATVGQYADARFNTEFGKYVPNEGTLILQEAVNKEPLIELKPRFSTSSAGSYSDPLNENIVDLLMPMLIKSTAEDEFAPFYLASPCEADMEVSVEDNLRCLEYMHDLDSNFVYCENPKKFSSVIESLIDSTSPCGSLGIFTTFFDEEFADKIADLVNNGMQKEVIFEDSDGDGKNDVVHDPIMGFTFNMELNEGDIVCCEHSPLTGDKSHGWLERTLCESEIGAVVADSLCENSRDLLNSGIRGANTRPHALIKEILHADLESEKIKPDINEDSFRYSCHKQEIEPIISSWGDILLFGEGSDALICYAPLYEQRGKELKDVLTDSTKAGMTSSTTSSEIAGHGIEVIFELTEEGEIKNPMHILIGVNNPVKSYDNYYRADYVLLSDRNMDGKLDSVSAYNLLLHKSQYLDQSGLDAILETVPARIFSDNDFDGSAEHLSSTYCEADVLIIEPHLGDHPKENNFCYNDKREWVGIATTVAGFAIDATVKAIPTPATWLIGTAADCWLAYKTTDWVNPDWPSNDWG